MASTATSATAWSSMTTSTSATTWCMASRGATSRGMTGYGRARVSCRRRGCWPYVSTAAGTRSDAVNCSSVWIMADIDWRG
jgi:hypothetical protein